MDGRTEGRTDTPSYTDLKKCNADWLQKLEGREREAGDGKKTGSDCHSRFAWGYVEDRGADACQLA